MELLQVERGHTISVATKGTPNAIVLNSNFVETTSKPNELIISGKQIGSSVVHIFDENGRQTVRVEVIELRAIEREIRQRAIMQERKLLNYPDRSLRIKYSATDENTTQGNRIGVHHQNQIERQVDHIAQIRVGVPEIYPFNPDLVTGPNTTLVGDLYMERYFNKTIKSGGVTQPRNMSVTLKDTPIPILGDMDVQVLDNYTYFSHYTIPGYRLRGVAVRPCESRLRFGQKARIDCFYYEGYVKPGSIVGLPPGIVPPTKWNCVRAFKIEPYIWDQGKLIMMGVHRYGRKTSAGNADNVVAGGYDFGFLPEKKVHLEGEFASNGTQTANDIRGQIRVLDWMHVYERAYKIGKMYKSVIGEIGPQGEQAWENRLYFYPPFFNKATDFNLSSFLYKDKNDVNINNINELNTQYSAGGGVKLPWSFSIRGNYNYSDTSGTSMPYVYNSYLFDLNKEFRFKHPLLRKYLPSLTIFGGTKRDEWDKSKFVPGFNAIYADKHTGFRANAWNGIWINLTYASAVVKELNQPEAFPATIYPRELDMGVGYSQSFAIKPVPPFDLNCDFHLVKERDPFNRIHNPFSDRDRLEGSGGITMHLAKGWELFNTWFIKYQKSSTIDDAKPIVDVSVFAGFRTQLDTNFVFEQKGRVSGIVFQDLNLNGQFDQGEPGVSGITLHVAGGGPSARSDRNGHYNLRSVKEGACTVGIDANQIPEGYFFTTPNYQDLFVIPQEKFDLNFGIATEVEVRGRVYNDINENSAYDEGIDEPVKNVRMTVETGQSAYTKNQGIYAVRKIMPGAHTATVGISTLPDGYSTLAPVRKDFEGKGGDVVEYNIPLKAQRSMSGVVFEDTNSNGNKDTSESGLANVEIELVSADSTVVASTQTDN
ncbi:MAG: hypothetical protein HZC17_09720, partial [Candidatus Omnitrophica bacterium]|nr:hypothetical protein [Candidatus Omnitrophota bacterium]